MDRWKATTLVLVGILAGVVFAGPQVTDADGHQATQFKECAALRLETKFRKAISDPIPVPAGWTAVGGAATGNYLGVVLCR